jgi:AcrR family transcriptional regulator
MTPLRAQVPSGAGGVPVDGDDLVAAAGQADAHDQAGRAGSDDRDLHPTSSIIRVTFGVANMVIMGAGGGAVKRFAPGRGMNTPAKRAYRSAVRDDQARATRRSIVKAAAELFQRDGYAATTIDAIAAAAGVSRKTVFTVGGSKFALLKNAFDWSLVGDDEPIPMVEREPVQRIIATTDPGQAVRRWAEMITDTAHRVSPIGAVLVAAAQVDADAAAMLRTSDAHRLEGARAFVDHLASIGGLRAGIDPIEAADLCWLAMGHEPYQRLVIERGWPPDRYRSWLTAAVSRELLEWA